MNIKKLQQNLAEAAGLKLENKAKGLCIDCGKPAIPNCYSSAGIREFHVSGLCEKCFDRMGFSEKTEA